RSLGRGVDQVEQVRRCGVLRSLFGHPGADRRGLHQADTVGDAISAIEDRERSARMGGENAGKGPAVSEEVERPLAPGCGVCTAAIGGAKDMRGNIPDQANYDAPPDVGVGRSPIQLGVPRIEVSKVEVVERLAKRRAEVVHLPGECEVGRELQTIPLDQRRVVTQNQRVVETVAPGAAPVNIRVLTVDASGTSAAQEGGGTGQVDVRYVEQVDAS